MPNRRRLQRTQTRRTRRTGALAYHLRCQCGESFLEMRDLIRHREKCNVSPRSDASSERTSKAPVGSSPAGAPPLLTIADDADQDVMRIRPGEVRR